MSDCGLLLSVLEPAALKNTQLQSTLLQNFQPQEEVIELQLKVGEYHVECEYSISNGGGTGQEYPQNLLNPGEEPWNKWCANPCPNSRSYVVVQFKNTIHFS